MEKGQFWEGIERYLTEEEKIPTVEAWQEERKPDEVSSAFKELSASAEPSSQKRPLSTIDSSHKPLSPLNQCDSDDLDQLRTKYIVGKLAGKDLYDHRGKVIIRKDMVITEDVIQRADQDGKLAELIVNMMIPDFGV